MVNIINETKKRTFLRTGIYSATTTSTAILLTWLWFGETFTAITLNATIIAFAFTFKYFYERYWLRVRWGLKQ